MRLVWWVLVVIGVVLIVGGAYAAVSAQSAINYDKSCEHPVACTTKPNPRPLGLSSALTASLEEAQAVQLLGIVLIGGGLAAVVYGVYIHPSIRKARSTQAPRKEASVEPGQPAN